MPSETLWPFGYIPLNDFIERLCKRPASVDALLTVLEYPGMPGSVKGLTIEEKLERARVQAAHLQKTLPQFRKLSVDDILICDCYEAFTDEKLRIPLAQFDAIFGPVEEQLLTKPFARHFYQKGYTVFLEVPIGKSRADILAYSRTVEPRLIAVELKTKVIQLKKGFAQLMDYQTGVDAAYLGTTPGCAVKYLSADVDVIDPKRLDEELRRAGAGLVVLDGVDGPCHVITPAPPVQPRPETREWLIRRCEEIIAPEVPAYMWSD